MKSTRALLAVVAGLVAPASLHAQTGPDVIVGDLVGFSRWGGVGSQWSYTFGTTSCNVGTQNLLWIANTNQHPVITQNFFRLAPRNGAPRFEQIGKAWLKHAWAAINNNICGSCNGQLGQVLGVGCSDPYSSGINGDQQDLGPRAEINAFTGVYPYPYTNQFNVTGNATFKRIQVLNSDLDPALNPGATYFAESQYVTQDDAAAGNGLNNASYRRFLVGALTTTGYTLSFTSTTQRTKPAIQAWKDADPSVTLVTIDIPGEGRVFAAARATDLGNGLWDYEYAVQNFNSHRAVGRVTVPVPGGVNVTSIGFHDPEYHSGEVLDNTDWPGVRGSADVSWATTPFNPAILNPTVPALSGGNANAIRWGTVYNFRFVADRPPTTGNVQLGLWRPGTPDAVVAVLPVPAAPPPPSCPGDANGDRQVNAADLSVLLANFGFAASGAAAGDFNGDGLCDSADLSILLANFGGGC